MLEKDWEAKRFPENEERGRAITPEALLGAFLFAALAVGIVILAVYS